MNPNPSEQSMLAITAALLDRGRSIDRLSCSMTVGALIALMGIGILDVAEPLLGLTLASSVLAGLICLYLSIRVGFDAAIFHQIAAAKDGSVSLQSLDDVLRELGLLATNKVGRSVNARIVGARRLFHRQIYVALLQVVLFFVGAMYTVLK